MNDVDGKVIVGTELETKSFDAQIKKLEKDLEIMTQALETDMKIPVELRMNEDERLKLENDIERTRNRIISLKGSVEEVGNETSEMSKKMLKGFDKGIKSLKNFGIRLLGISSIYGIVSKASSVWLSQDTELAQKLQSVWVGLGAIIEPIINAISNALLKGLGYINEFIKAFTDGKVDIVAKANAKMLEKQAKSQEKLNNAIQDYDFDVIRKQKDTIGSETGIDTSGLIQIPELNQSVVKKLQDLAKVLKENKDLIKEVGIVLGVTFGSVAIGKLLKNIGVLMGGNGVGLLGLQGLLVGIATAWTIKLYMEGYEKIKKNLDEASVELNAMVEATKEVTEGSKKLTNELKEKIDTEELNEEQIKKIAKVEKSRADILVENSKKIADQTGLLQMLLGTGKEFQKEMGEQVKQVDEMAKRMKMLYEAGGITKEEYDKFVNDTLPKFREQVSRAGISTKEIDEIISNLPKSKDIVLNIKAEDKTTSVLDKIKKGLGGLFSSVSKKLFGGGGSGERFAYGGIVTQPTRALIGEAGYPEAVVPMTKDYLSTLASEIGRYSSNSGGGVVNIYLDGRLIQRQVKNTQNDRNFATNN